MPEPQWLTMKEAEIRFKCSSIGIVSMIEAGTLQAIKVGRNAGRGNWRILDPSPEFFEKQKAAEEEHVFNIPLLTVREVAEIVGTTPLNMRQLIFRGHIKSHSVGKFGALAKTSFFTVGEVRRFLWRKEKRQRQGRRVVKIQRVIEWCKTLMDAERAKTTEGYRAKDELYELLEEIMTLPAEPRLASLRHLWREFDLVQSMVLASSTKEDHQQSEAQNKSGEEEHSSLAI